MRPAVSAYRSLLKAQRELFAGDTAARLAARNETRARFVEHSSAPAEQVEALVNDALDAAGFIRQNVAQAVLNERGNYELNIRPEHQRPAKDGPAPLPCGDSKVNL